MNIEQYIPDRVKKQIKVVYDPVQNWYFNQKYKKENSLSKSMGDTEFQFDTSDTISKEWFYPRYKGEEVHEPAVTRYLVDIVKNDDVFFDIGANVGYFSVVAAASGAKTHSFEIDPRLGSIIYTNLEQNSESYTVVVGAVSDQTDDIVSFLSHQSKNLSTNQIVGASHGFCVPTLSIDSYVKNRDLTPNLMKIDVEGAETAVVAGADETLACEDLRAVLLEVHPKLLDSVDTEIGSIYSAFVDRGFDCYRFKDHRSTEMETAKIKMNRSDMKKLDKIRCYSFRGIERHSHEFIYKILISTCMRLSNQLIVPVFIFAVPLNELLNTLIDIPRWFVSNGLCCSRDVGMSVLRIGVVALVELNIQGWINFISDRLCKCENIDVVTGSYIHNAPVSTAIGQQLTVRIDNVLNIREVPRL
jgi:FkbM family methyltransferase